MSLDWNLAQPVAGPLDLLRQAGQMSLDRMRVEEARRAQARQQRIEAARPNIAAAVQSGDFGSAQAQAIGAGDDQLLTSIRGMSEEHRKQLDHEAEWMGKAARGLRRMPADRRQQALLNMAPTLRKNGFSDEDLNDIDLSDEGLDGRIGFIETTKDHLASLLEQARINDIDTDNDRADLLANNTVRNTDDLIADRSARRQITVRGQNMTDDRQRRGQDMADDRSKRLSAERAARTPVSVRTLEEARGLPPGTVFITPDGRRKVR